MAEVQLHDLNTFGIYEKNSSRITMSPARLPQYATLFQAVEHSLSSIDTSFR